ncbi:MAG: hypothetical protein L3K23_05645 [Thermoplasmata archaeon]|nr:hypothetical protein [Thermoplasmata archaeon]
MVAAAVAGGAIALGVSFGQQTHVGLPVSVWAALTLAFVAEGISFIGLSFLGAHLSRSVTGLIAGLLLLVILLTLLWFPLTAVLQTGEVSSSTLGMFNPVQVSISIVGWSVFYYSGGGPFIIAVIGGLGIVTLLLVGWIVIPISIATALFRSRD